MAVPEKTIENKFVKEARKLGCLTRKLNGAGNRNWPDQLILIPFGPAVLFEFKRPGEELRPSQMAWHEDAMEIGHKAYVFTSWIDALDVVREMISTFAPVRPR